MITKTSIEPNKKQKECIENIQGEYLVLAGPGTGKTFTIIERIKNMIKKGINPEKILCLTFTDVASKEMKMRLEKELNTTNTDVNIYTYHSFCADILENYSSEFELPSNYKIMNSELSLIFLKEIIDEINPKAFRTEKNDPYYYINTIKNRIEEIKKNRLTKEKYFENLNANPDWIKGLNALQDELSQKQKNGNTKTKTLEGDILSLNKKINQAIELWDFYEHYQDKMKKKNFLDFYDMINFVLDKFEKDYSFLSKIANSYEYILVDEYQDTNNSQNTIIFNLLDALDTKNIFVVGDDSQIIYTFQGAKLDTMENFLTHFPDTKVICLDENMRSTQNILNCARMVETQDLKRLEINPKYSKYNITKELKSKNPNLSQDIPVTFTNYIDEIQECNSIVDEIEKIIKTNKVEKLSDIAILTRTNAELVPYCDMLKQRNIPSEIKDGKNIFEIKSSIVIFAYMQMLSNPELYSNKIFEILLCPPFSINNLDFIKIKEELSKNKCLIDCIKSIDENEFAQKDKIKKFIADFEYLKEYKNKESIKNTLLEIGSITGLFDYYINYDINKCENIAGIKKLIDIAHEYSNNFIVNNFEDFVDYIDVLIEDGIAILADKAPISYNAIQLSTYYSAKGREFKYVFMPTLISAKWESDRKNFKSEIPLDISEYKTKEELDEMKLSDRIKVLYVGMTRAKEVLRLSGVQEINKKTKKISKLISNIENTFEKVLMEPYGEESYWQEISKSMIKKQYDYKKDFHTLIDAKLKNIRFSPSAINEYLKCPRMYLYDYLLDLSSKSEAVDVLSYGSAFHKAMEKSLKYAIQNQEYPKIEYIIDEFNKCFEKLAMSDFEHREIYKKRADSALRAYYPQIINTPFDMLYKTEESIEFELDENTKFFGIIDRIDKNKDGTYSIYDYKTGNAKPISKIAPDEEFESYYNQMGLYKYFYQKKTGCIVKDSEFIFVEDFKNNVSIKYSDEDLKEIILKYKEAIKNIRDYQFEPTLKKENCKNCSYRAFCNMNII